MSVIEHQQQGDLNCTSASIAMIVNRSVEEVTRLFHDKLYAGEAWFTDMLDYYGVSYSTFDTSDRTLMGSSGDGAYLLAVPSLNRDATLHNLVALIADGKYKLYDPNRGVEGRRWYVAGVPESPSEVSLGGCYMKEAFVSSAELLRLREA